ncbi:MAG: MBL fold metallo-hydrolase [Candidatus Bathyarchaeota archaeon]
MKITVIGSGGTVLTKSKACPSILIDEDILIDCGPGSLRNLVEVDADLTKIKKIMITHYHADHVGDLIPLLWAIQLAESKESIEIVGFRNIEKFTVLLLKIMHTPKEYTIFNIKFRSLAGGEEFDEVKTFKTKHTPVNIAYRVNRNGKSVCCTGDTRFYKPLASFASDCDVLIHDATFLDEQKKIASLTNHSTASQAGKIAKMAGVKTLMLTHILPHNIQYEDKYIKQASKEFDGEIIVAKDLQTIRI